MRKLFSILAAVLFAGGMFAQVTITPANSGWGSEAGEQSGVVEGVTIAVTNGLASSGQDPDQLRIYKDATLTISSEANISKIEFTCTANGTSKYGPGCFNAQEGYTYDESGKTGTWEGSATSISFTAGSNQVRATQIVVTLGEAPKVATPVITGAAEFTDSVIVTITCSTPDADIYYTTDGTTDPKCDCSAAPEYKQPIVIKETTTIMAAAYTGNDWSAVATKTFTKVEPLADPTNCAEAAEAALSVSGNNVPYNDGKEYTIEGYVTSIATDWSSDYKNISFWMADAKDGGNVLQAYRAACETEADAPAVGDKVAVTGKLTKYNTTPEFAAGCTFVITEKPEPIVPGAWTEILFEEAVVPDSLPADAQFEFGGLKVAITDSENKMSIDGNKAYFGTADENVLYAFRLKTGGKSQSGNKNNFITITVPEDGELRLAVRTGSNSDETRNLVLVQGEDTIYNKVVKEADAIEVAITDTTSIKVYPYVTVSVKKGEIAVGYPVNSLNFYSFAFKVAEAPAEINTCAAAAEAALSVSENNELYNNGAVYSIQGFVTAIQTAYSSQYNNITFWMADTEDGGKVLEAYRAVCESEENAPNVGDKVTVTGSLTKYNSTPEFAAGCTFVIVERAPKPENLGEKTIAEFLELKNAKDTCILTGVVDNIVNTVYGNFDLIDETDTLYVYGLLTPEGEAKKFAELGVNEGDTLTIKAVYGEYQGKPQAPNAVFVSVSKKPAEIIDIEITEGVRYIDAVESDGWWQIYGENETYFITLSNSNVITEASGTYTVAELDAEYSFIEVLETEQDIAFVDGSITLTIDDADVVTVEGTLNGSDGNIYNIRIVFVAPVAETTVEVTIDNAELDESYAESYGLYGVAGLSEDSVYVQLYIWTEDLVGEFTADDLYDNYSGIIVGEEALEIYSADITITLEDGVYTVQADLLTYGNVLYKVTMIVPAGTGVENNTINVKAVKSIENGTLFIQKNGVRYNALGQVVR